MMATAYRFAAMPSDDPVAIELCSRIGDLERDLPALSMGDLGRRVDAIRAGGRGGDYPALAEVASGLSEALARDGRAALVRPYLQAMREACGCARGDGNAVHALLASIGVRLGG